MGVVEPGKFKRGQTVEFEDSLWKVVEFSQSKTARQATRFPSFHVAYVYVFESWSICIRQLQ